MGFLRADGPMRPMLWERFVIARRGPSIGTLLFRSQWKRVKRLGFGLTLCISGATPATAFGAGAAAPAVETALPAPPPPAGGPPVAGEPLPLPPAPAPRSNSIPPAAAGTTAVPVAEYAAPPGVAGSDLPALPPPPLGARLHDGFYLRMAVGIALSGALVATDSKSVSDYSFQGAGAALDLWIGGTPTPGLAMGAALSLLGLEAAKTHVDGKTVSEQVNANMGMLGYFVDAFPDPARGLHFGGALGLASNLVEANDIKRFGGGGLGLQAWGGYQFWVSPEWSLGGMLRVMGSVTREEKDSVTYQASMGGGTLSFTALYH
jgi:hypothetical protein